jgi:acetyl-CoA carboxylase carboxyltransferase component
VLELKAGFGRAVVTSLIRIAGRPVGVVANQPMFLAGAIDSPASDKAAHFIQVCDAFDIPILSLCDTPGLMVGPDVERTGLVRKSARVLTAFANATVPVMTVVLRKAYGLGYYVMGSQPLLPRSCSRGRQRSTAAWGWRARSTSSTRPSSTPSPSPKSAPPCTSA